MADTDVEKLKNFPGPRQQPARSWGDAGTAPMPINRDGADYNIRSGAAKGAIMGDKEGIFDLDGNWKMKRN